ncbi:MAG TPA: chromosome segregation protein SMC [Pseudomonadales bacterium]
MRLKCIKLAGFKSFVDPTTVSFPSNLCAVVGPNGCGKSNIIDAVRWVMGESSAKNLRGESMTDVIFNGSSNRKPVGQASIELVFDNADGSVGGEYAAFAEISIKRRVTRESDNQYFLNGQKCRRRDITDIFLGTGLGPRSYAIIEQGMISRLIEAKPEELRIYIEEAAGISKYKERRKETESRMRRTAENLERLTDIRDELERQLQHLQRQAQAAEKYTQYKQEERLYKAQLQALEWRELDVQAQKLAGNISRFELDVEAAVTRQTTLETAVEKLFTAHGEARQQFDQVQGRYYALGADVARAEQTIAHQQERHKKLHDDLAMTRENCLQAEQLLHQDASRQAQWQEELDMLAPELELLAEAEENSQITLAENEEYMQAWQQEWDGFNSKAADSRQKAEVQQSRIQHIEKVLQRIDERIVRFEHERGELTAGEVEQEIDELVERIAELDMQLEADQQTLDKLQQQIEQKRQAGGEHGRRLDELKTTLQSRRGRLASLEALQQAALGGSSDSVAEWQTRHGLAGNSLLAEQLDVEAGWEMAVETVLSGQLQSVCVDDIATLAALAGEIDSGSLYLLDNHSSVYQGTLQAPRLWDKTGANPRLSALLAGIYVAESLDQALALRGQLAAHESVITADGLWLGSNWLRFMRDEDAQAGVLKRKQEIDELQQQIAALEDEKQQLEAAQQANTDALNHAERERDDCQKQYKTVAQKHSELTAQLSGRKVKVEQIAGRKEQLQRDIDEARSQYRHEQEGLAEARAMLQQAIEAMETDADQRETLIRRRDEIRQQLDQARDRARNDRDRAHQLAIREQALNSQLQAVAESLLRTRSQAEQLIERRSQLERELAEYSEPGEDLALELEALLDKRLAVEQELAGARQQVEAIEHELRESERQRNAFQQEIQGHRSQLEQARLAAQTITVQRDNLKKQLLEADFELQAVLDALPDEANQHDWQQELERIGQRISRLGAINLAAIEEYKVAQERKQYLDEQNNDLQEALTTLENAIRKIDRETRSRFKDTFDQINAGVQDLFPKVFGGGRAYLEMTGDDLLDTGIAIMAQPPGKRNSTIHLLSGGEKALTAIALVFSIFRLNPAPFCMLDEVDAPLDDANVGRYARMVKEMSEHVQFIYITHNKIAMEMAQQLLGVTMHEPGVSRMVTVDVEEAAELAAS